MFSRLFLIMSLLLSIKNGFAQEANSHMTFILLIDDEVPVRNIIDGFFSLYDSAGYSESCIPFNYHVGWIELTDSDYHKLLFHRPNDRIAFSFTYKVSDSSRIYKHYTLEIPQEMINKVYLIIGVYNYENLESREKYFIPGGSYGATISSPGLGAGIFRWKHK
jgi:hypothetical protein